MKLNILSIGLLLSIFLISCKKDVPKNIDPPAEEVIGLTSEQAAILDTILHIDMEPNEIVLEDGTLLSDAKAEHPEWFEGIRKTDIFSGKSPSEIKRILLLRFADAAEYLTEKDNFKYDAIDKYQPKQHGLVYSWGGDQIEKRHHPEDGVCQKYYIYGLDCSGFLYLVLSGDGKFDVERNKAAIEQSSSAYLQYALDKLYPNGFRVEVFHKGDQIESGDLIYWSGLPIKDKITKRYIGTDEASHIGIALKSNKGKLAVFQSNGNPGDCEGNLIPARGPNALDLNSTYWFNKEYSEWKIIRIIPQDPLPPQPEYKIGDVAFGGIIFYLDNTKQHGMVRSVQPLDGNMWRWDVKALNGTKYQPVEVGATGTAIGDGLANTDKIISVLGDSENAANACKNYTGGGYNDWYLPSRDELILAYKNVGIGSTCSAWTSSEITYSDGKPSKAYFIYACSNYTPKEQHKHQRMALFAVRNF